MKKELRNKLLLLLTDASILPGCLLCRWLTSRMLATSRDCAWAVFGGRCVSCGGTHFVSALVRGNFREAFMHNQLFFVLAVVMAVCLILLHFAVFFKAGFAKKLLKAIFSIWGLIVGSVAVVGFVIIRNIPAFVNLFTELGNVVKLLITQG